MFPLGTWSEVEFTWTIDSRSHLIKPTPGLTVLVESKDMEDMGSNIVAFTFTDRAGAELKDRIVELVRDQLGEIHGMAEMYVGTIHGYCLQLLQSHLPEYFKFQVLNEVQTRLLIDRASVKTGLRDLGLRRWAEGLKGEVRRAQHEERIVKVLEHHKVDLVVLAGYMRILTPFLMRPSNTRTRMTTPT